MAHTCVRGAELMYKYCEEKQLPVERCGKFIVAANEGEHAQVEKLYSQGTANGVQGLEIIYRDQVCIMMMMFTYNILTSFSFRSKKWNPMFQHTVHCIHQIQASPITGSSPKRLLMKYANQGKDDMHMKDHLLC